MITIHIFLAVYYNPAPPIAIQEDKSLLLIKESAVLTSSSAGDSFIVQPSTSEIHTLVPRYHFCSSIINFRQSSSPKKSLLSISWLLIYKYNFWLISCTERSNLCQDSLYRHTFFGGIIFGVSWLAGNHLSFN